MKIYSKILKYYLDLIGIKSYITPVKFRSLKNFILLDLNQSQQFFVNII